MGARLALLPSSGALARPEQPRAASPFEPLGLRQMSELATQVVAGAVESLDSAWNPDRSRIHTRITMRVEQVLAGRAGERVVFRVLGGAVGDPTILMSEMPRFRVGEAALVFLTGRGESPPGTDAARSAAGEGSPFPRKTVGRIAEAIRTTCPGEECPAYPNRGGFRFPSRSGRDAGDFFHGLPRGSRGRLPTVLGGAEGEFALARGRDGDLELSVPLPLTPEPAPASRSPSGRSEPVRRLADLERFVRAARR